MSRETVSLRGLERAVDRVRSLEVEIDAAFAELEASLESCREARIEIVVRFGKVGDAAWAAWRNQGYAES